MICYAFPLAHEAGELLQSCTQKEEFSLGSLRCTLANFRGRPILVALIGMGQTRASENTQTIFQYFRPKGFVLAGYAGALIPQMKVGQVVISNNLSSQEIQPFLRLLSGFDFASFCTADEVVGTPEARDRYAQKTHHQSVDMESAAVAEVVLERSVPFMAVRVVCDDYHQVLPTGALAAGFDAPNDRATPIRLLIHLALHRSEIAPFKQFVAGLTLARKNLTKVLEGINDDLPSSW
jgi:adenosylhomocysteine nucleosidase